MLLGNAIYEAVCSRHEKIFAIDDHVNRFFSNASLPEIAPPCTKDELRIDIYHKEMAEIYKKGKRIGGADTRFFHCNIKTINSPPL